MKQITEDISDWCDTSEPLTPERIKHLQGEIMRALHYYAYLNAEYPIMEVLEQRWWKLNEMLTPTPITNEDNLK